MYLYLKSVSYTPDCLNILWFCGIVLNLLTNLLNVNGDCCNVSDGIHIPDFAEQLFLGIYMVWMLRKESKQIKFLTGKCFLHTVHHNPSCSLVNTDTANLYHIIFRSIASNQPLVTCQMRLYPRHQFAWRKRLRNIIIRSQA